jgi:hypothetical protein
MWIGALALSGWLGVWAAWAGLKQREGGYLGVALCLAMTWLMVAATGALGRFAPAIQVILAASAMSAIACWVAARRTAAG